MHRSASRTALAGRFQLDYRTNRHASHGVLPAWLGVLRSAAKARGIDYQPVAVRGWLSGADLIAAVRSLGGEVHPAEPFHHWILEARFTGRAKVLKRQAPELVHDRVAVSDFLGVVEIVLDERRYVALRTDQQTDNLTVDAALVLGGPTLEETLALASRIKRAHQDLYASELVPCGTAATPSIASRVTEEELVLPQEFKRDLLEYTDNFWRSAAICTELGVAATRGVLFVGAPGTGKTHTVRHLLGRYENCRRFVYVAESNGRSRHAAGFREMVDMVSESEQPAIVVLEDLDRICESGTVTPEFLLNVLDGLLQPQVPVLWLATSNDPTDLAENILDRPGRFDRIFVFPMPELEERARLVARYSPWPVDNSTIEDIARGSHGLSGAHLKEVCYAAALASAEQPASYGSALEAELARVSKQSKKARDYASVLQSMRVGFGV